MGVSVRLRKQNPIKVEITKSPFNFVQRDRFKKFERVLFEQRGALLCHFLEGNKTVPECLM